jgi:hypothetical protein
MMAWSGALLLAGLAIGPYGLNLLSPSVLLLVDPIVAMALAMVGVLVGLGTNVRHLRFDPALALVATAGIVLAVLREPVLLNALRMTLAIGGIAAIVALAGWLLVRQTESEREQQVFAAGSLLLVGGAAAYLSLSAIFAGFFAALVWNVAGDVARARLARDFDRFQHPLIVLLLLVAGASLTISIEALGLAALVVFVQFADRWPAAGQPARAGLVAVAAALDVFRGAFG